MELVITLDDDLADRARAEAERRGESVEAWIRGLIDALTPAVDPAEAAEAFVRLTREHPGRPDADWRFSRAELYDRGDR